MGASTALYVSLAVGLCLTGAILAAAGYVMQKKGHIAVIELNEIHEIQDEDTKAFWSNKIWVSGLVIYATGSIFTASALNFGAQSLLAPLSALVLVFNAIFATQFLGEPFKRNNLYGIILVMIGSIMAVVFGPKSSTDTVTLKYVESCWTATNFLIFFSILSFVAMIDFILVKIYERKNFSALENHNITHGGNFLMMSYIALAAYFGSTNVLFMKKAVIILGSFDLDYFTDYLFYVTIVGIVVINGLLEYFRQRALVYFDAIYVVPIYQVLLIIGSALMGAIFFNEFALLSPLQLTLFCVSIFITLLGVAELAYDIGAVYTKMLNKKSKDEEPMSVRSKAQKALYRRKYGKHHLVFPAFHGVGGSYLAAHFHSIEPRFMFNSNLSHLQVVGEDSAELQSPASKEFKFEDSAHGDEEYMDKVKEELEDIPSNVDKNVEQKGMEEQGLLEFEP